MEKPAPTPRPAPAGPPRPRWNSPAGWGFALLALALLLLWVMNAPDSRSLVRYDEFRRQLEAGNVERVRITGQEIEGQFRVALSDLAAALPAPVAPPAGKSTEKVPAADAKTNDDSDAKSQPAVRANKSPAGTPTNSSANRKFTTVLSPLVGEDLDKLLLAKGVKIDARRPSDGTGLLLLTYVGVTALLVGGMWLMFRRARDQITGGISLGGFSKSPARRYEGAKAPITFADVAGLEGVKHDLQEVVEFLKSPEKFQRLGGRIPKGTLLMGPPGTGKTLLAKAVAGEAGVPFFSINGSEFIQMFVGVGASRVRDMFATAKAAAPCILFIDEIDAVGRVRGAGLGGGHDEREQTLNQILSEMDGFSPSESVIVLAATNRPDVLDPALLRPGRFDRHVTVDRPNLKGRIAIFKVHARDVPLASNVDLERLAAGTVGLTGADIRNLVNEAALLATRLGKNQVDNDDFEQARDKVLMGAKREEVLAGKEKTMTAYHEAGHALLAWLLPGIDRLHKVTIIPRGRALGVTQLLPEEDRLNIGESDLHVRLAFMLGGRAAEKLIFGEHSAGAEDDLKRATQLARRMVTHWGMSERIGPVAYRTSESHPFLGKEIAEQREFSEHTARVIDEEVARILHAAADRAYELLQDNREKLDKLANALETREIVEEREVEALIGPSTPKPSGRNGRSMTVEPGNDSAVADPLNPAISD